MNNQSSRAGRSTKNPAKTENPLLHDCLTQMLDEVREEHLCEVDIRTLGTDLWTWSQTTGGAAVRVRTATIGTAPAAGVCLLEAAGPDRPFLVDSLVGICAERRFEIRALFHPIVQTGSGNTSLIQIHLPKLTHNEQDVLQQEARATLQDVISVTSDHDAMRARMAAMLKQVQDCPHVTERYRDEAVQFLHWLQHEHFVFLGVRDYTFKTGDDGEVLAEEPIMVPGSNLGLLRDETRNILDRRAEPLLLAREIRSFLSEPESLVFAKATLVSRVHRRVACDYVGIKHYGPTGNVTGETRFLGLYTAETYHESVRSIPLLRRRVARVIERCGALKGTHNEKMLLDIMEDWPRDELIQAKSDQLVPIMKGTLHLTGRPRVCLFTRHDRFDRFVSVMVFVPRETYDTALRKRICDALEDAWNGHMTSFQPSFTGTSALVRVFYEIALPDNAPKPDIKALEAKIVDLSRSWGDRFRSAIMNTAMSTGERTLASLFFGAFNAAYREAFTPEDAMKDVATLALLNTENPVRLRAFRQNGDKPDGVRAKIYSRNGAIALSDCVPVFERMGLFVTFETGYPVTPDDKPVADAPDTYWVHSLFMHRMDGEAVDLDTTGKAFEEAFTQVWCGFVENDGFNALIFKAGLTWREAALCRTLCAYRHQTGLDPARQTQIEALNANPVLTRQLVDLFITRFDPAITDNREQAGKHKHEAVMTGLKQVKSLDHDRVIRRTCDLVMAICRTNYFQTNKDGTPRPFIAFKIISRNISDLPAPKPYREIFMSSPQVEGIHCRFGAVARGGLRWSDRRDDFRTEILGLVKAQQVKNAVIVPVGAKGGFFAKTMPPAGTQADIRASGIAAYKTFITSLLELTDNLVDGTVQSPPDTVIHDDEDPYLVVAADKGTAAFSDIANEISMERGFWLGDAFASGGSAGYDHKKMGITARGAWEAVKRHFREAGKNIQTEPFTVIGCGDMSGDVFGNGMLLSKQIRLLAAFNHLHIFVDPDPQDPERLWQERQRLFNLGRSNWTNYDRTLISKGGGVFERSAKSIDLSPQIKALIGLDADTLTPDALIHALLKTECELLWLGGIGSYVKARHETHADVGDRANDTVRVNADEIRARVIGEGANLGLTQAARIEMAHNGTRLNTDAIDNSAGVDSSDHEVNIKILCGEAIRKGLLPSGERNRLLAAMTDEVAEHVLAHNYAQTGALALAADTAHLDHDAMERLMVHLEGRGVLNRSVEGLPDTATMAARKEEGLPLTRPEIAVLMAWTKIVLFDELVASDIPDDPWFTTIWSGYFPTPLHRYEAAMDRHRLKREIASTILANRIIDVCGPVFLWRLHEQTGAECPRIVCAFELARNLLNEPELRTQINALDNQIGASRQTVMGQGLAEALFDLTKAILDNDLKDTMAATHEKLEPACKAIAGSLPGCLSPFETGRLRALHQKMDTNETTTRLVIALTHAMFLSHTPLIASIASAHNRDHKTVFNAFQVIGNGLHLDHLRASAQAALPTMPYWDRLATRRLIRELETFQARATAAALQEKTVNAWLARFKQERETLIAGVRTYTASNPNFAQFSLATDSVRQFMHAVLARRAGNNQTTV